MDGRSFKTSDEYFTAIAALESSTLTIEIQLEATRKISATINDHTISIHGASKPQADIEKQQLLRLTDSVRREVEDSHESSSEQLSKSVSSTLITIVDALSHHDYTFQRLEARDRSDGAAILEASRHDQELLAALQQTQSEIIRTRLNRTYLEHANSHPYTNSREQEDEDHAMDQASLVRADLRTLHSEIDDVSRMFISHEHGDQLLSTRLKLKHELHKLCQRLDEDTLEELSSMTEQLERITNHAEMLQSQRILMQRLGEHLKDMDSSQQRVAPSTTSYGSVKTDGPALAALRQYLAVDDQSGQSGHSQKIHAAFRELTSHINSTLAIQTEQAVHLQKEMLEDTSGREHAASLDDLDLNIADTKSYTDTSSR